MTTILWKNVDSASIWRILFLTLFVTEVRSEWWSMGLNEASLNQASDLKVPCSEIQTLSRSQRTLCQRYRDHLRFVSEGASEAIQECQHQFRNKRWNCTTDKYSNRTAHSERPLFGKVIDIGSREAAFTYAISAAAVVHKVARACKEGRLTDCGCGDQPRPRALGPTWEWGGCGDNTLYAYGFAREFVDARERDSASPRIIVQSKARKAMNVHNNEAGRLAVVRSARPTCKCHGVSGSCSLNTCWLQTQEFRKIGDRIREKFVDAVEVRMTRKNGLRNRKRRKANPDVSQLVFLESSPDYCAPNPLTGVIGTKGRYCNKDSNGQDGCGLLCCGRPYKSYTEIVRRKCKCKFQWCCHVKCKICKEVVQRHVCA